MYIWPTENDARFDDDLTAAKEHLAQTYNDENYEKILGALLNRQGSFVSVPFGEVSSSGLDITLEKGLAVIGGYFVDFSADTLSPEVTLNASDHNRIWLQLSRDGNGKVNGASFVVRVDNVIPNDAVLVAMTICDATDVVEHQPRIGGVGWVSGAFNTSAGNSVNDLTIGWRPRYVILSDDLVGTATYEADIVDAAMEDWGLDIGTVGAPWNNDTGYFHALVGGPIGL